MTKNINLSIDENEYKSLTGSESNDARQETVLAKCMASPVLNSSITAYKFTANESLDINDFVKEINKQSKCLADTNNMDIGAKNLLAQSKALDAIFNALSQRAFNNFGNDLEVVETYMKLALKAQSQCRSTWEAISKIKNPPYSTFVKQANIAHGHQQVNNMRDNNQSTCEEILDNRPNELLEDQYNERVDFGEKATTSRVNKEMEAVGLFNRAKDQGR